jgi:hypothetical protein
VLPNLKTMATTVETLRFLGQLIPKTAEEHEYLENIAKSAYRNMAQAFVARWKLSIDDLTRTSPQRSHTSHYYHSPFRPIAPVVLGVVDEYMTLGLIDEGCQILERNLPTLPASSDKMWLKWHELQAFYRSILALLERCNSAPLNDLGSKWLIQAMKSAAKHLARSRPGKPPGWSAPPERRITCSCMHCRSLERFLNNHTQVTRRFSENVSIRKHLESSLGQSPGLRIETEKNGSPHTLVVNKVGLEYTQKRALREREYVKMRKEVGALCSPFAMNLFGGVITKVVGLERPVTAEVIDRTVGGTTGEGNVAGIAGGAARSILRSLQPTTASAQNIIALPALAGTKRKADVIDLTEDDPVSA